MAKSQVEAAVKHSLNGATLPAEQLNELIAYADKVGVPQYMTEAEVLRQHGFAAFKQQIIK